MRIIHKIRCKIDEPYRIRIGFGLSPIRNKRELKALIAFCKEELKYKPSMKLNPERKKVYEETISAYENDYWVHDYIREHVGWYWN